MAIPLHWLVDFEFQRQKNKNSFEMLLYFININWIGKNEKGTKKSSHNSVTWLLSTNFFFKAYISMENCFFIDLFSLRSHIVLRAIFFLSLFHFCQFNFDFFIFLIFKGNCFPYFWLILVKISLRNGISVYQVYPKQYFVWEKIMALLWPIFVVQ